MRVLLTSARAPVTLDLARRFSNCGDDVFLCESLRFACGRWSRANRQTFLTRGPNTDSAAYIESINNIITKEKIDLLVPTCEEIFYLAAYRNQIACDVCADSFKTLHDIHNKWEFSQIGGNTAAKVPETFQIKSLSELNEFRNNSQDLVFKPVFSRFASQTLIRPEASCLDSISVTEHRPWIAQRFIAGQELSTYSVANQGRLNAHCTYRSLFRAGIGSGICFEAESNPTITDFTKNFVKQLNFTGQVGFDFIVDEDRRVWVIEANPRATSGLHLFDESNNPLLTDALKGKDNPLLEPGFTPARKIGVAMLSFGLQDAMQRKQLKLYLRKLFSSKDVLFRWSDPLPTLALPFTLGELCWVAARERMTLQQATTFDIEWNGEPL